MLDLLFLFADETGHVSGILKTLPANTQLETTIDTMVAEAMKTSEIEGEYLSRKDVASSIRNKLGLNKKPDECYNSKGKIGYILRKLEIPNASRSSAKL